MKPDVMIWTPEPSCTHSIMACGGARKTSPLTIFHPLSSRSSLEPACKGAGTAMSLPAALHGACLMRSMQQGHMDQPQAHKLHAGMQLELPNG